MRTFLLGLVTALLMVAVVFAAISFSYQEKSPPEETAASVVEKFYEYISEAKIRGGGMLINEAYKMTDGAQSRTARARFLGIVNRYPPGFKVNIVASKIQENHAIVMIEYQLPSSFGGIYTVRDPIHLNVDRQSNTWKLDFRGDTDDQDRKTIAKAMRTETSDAASSASNSKGKRQ